MLESRIAAWHRCRQPVLQQGHERQTCRHDWARLCAAEMQATAYCGASLYGYGWRHLYGGGQRRVGGVDTIDIRRKGDSAGIDGLHVLLQAAGSCVKQCHSARRLTEACGFAEEQSIRMPSRLPAAHFADVSRGLRVDLSEDIAAASSSRLMWQG